MLQKRKRMLFLSFKIEIKDRVVGGKYKVLEKIFE